jgi:hypothetical protein
MSLGDWFFSTFVMSYDAFYGQLGTFWAHFLPWSAVIAYYLVITFLPKYLGENHKGFRQEIKWIAAAWNLWLSVVSGFMLVGVAVPYFEQVRKVGWWNVVCDADQEMQSGWLPSLFWAYLFAVTKYWELFDTVILILKSPGRKLLFLHWYHHITVLLFTWYGEYYHLTLGYQFIMVNAFVHLLMYFYYFLTELGIKPGMAIQISMTSLQILQMVYGMWIMFMWYMMMKEGRGCSCDKPDLIAISGALMYFSYFCLFGKMFAERYIFGKKKESSPASSSGKKSKPKAQ